MSETTGNTPTVEPARLGGPERLYLPELDGLRFFAFGLVFLFHRGVDWVQLSSMIGREATRCCRQNGWVGVQLFFILSGYLITTLLLREESVYGRVDLRAFWVRRILRIWPLYYFVLVIAFLVIPWSFGDLATPGGRATQAGNLPWFGAFLGNWRMALHAPVPFDAQSILWSVCVEEQFYLLVPLVVAFVPRRARIPLVVATIAGSVGLRGALARADANQLMIQFNTFAQFDTLLSGVLLALCLGTEPRGGSVGRVLFWLRWPLYAATIWVFSRQDLGHGEAWRRTWDFVAIWVVGVGLVAEAVTVDGWLRALLSYPEFVWLGKISYGLYMYHEVAFWMRDGFSSRVGWFPYQDLLLAYGTLALTIALASASYYGFEERFLRLKRGWTRVPSRPF